jgi:uncharacterized protein YyaL (SSP411 family)
VDREERPDVDQLYMTAVQILTRHGGWPMSVFLTPDLRPFYGGTYFPPTDGYGRPGFPTILRSLHDAYHNRPADVAKSATQIVEILQKVAEPPAPRRAMTIDAKWIERIIERSSSDYDPTHGGFGNAPKFPRQTLLELLLAWNAHHPDAGRLKQITHTLDAIARGGIRDHLGGGFHRYSTDARWLVPHFEIMLYDNAMLAWLYIEAYRQTENLFYAKVARGVFDFVLREMTSPEGAFYTAFDAEVDAMEGQSYLWTEKQVEEVLGEADARVFNAAYGLDQGPNFEDPHHGPGHPDQNVLFLPKALTDEQDAQLEPLRAKLLAARLQRKQPLLDTKILTSWNALMIRALAFGGQALQEKRYLDAAEKCADFLLRHHRTPDGGLYRTSREGKAKYNAFLDDYSFFIQALIDLRDAQGREVWRDHAATLTILMLSKFRDDTNGGFFFTEANADDLVVRQKVASDSPLPSGNAIAASALLQLGQHDEARRVIERFAQQMSQQGEAMSAMLEATFDYVQQFGALDVQASSSADVSGPNAQDEAISAVDVAADWTSPTELILKLEIAEGYHLNAATVTGPLVPTRIDVQGDVASTEYTPGKRKTYPYAAEAIAVYETEAFIRIVFKQPQTKPVMASLRYQACTDEACLPPVAKPLEIPAP